MTRREVFVVACALVTCCAAWLGGLVIVVWWVSR